MATYMTYDNRYQLFNKFVITSIKLLSFSNITFVISETPSQTIALCNWSQFLRKISLMKKQKYKAQAENYIHNFQYRIVIDIWICSTNS